MRDLSFLNAQEIDDNLDKPYLITIHLVNGQQLDLGRDTEEEALATVGLIRDSLLNESKLLYSGHVIIKLPSVVSITLTRQN